MAGATDPFAGTMLGAACVFFRNNLSELVQRALTGFAAGVMVAASIWSLLPSPWNRHQIWNDGPLCQPSRGFAGILFLHWD